MYHFVSRIGMTALGTLSAIAIERYIIISRSLHCQKLSNASAVLTIFFIWIYSLSQSLPPLFGWNQYVVETPGIACSLNWEEPGSKHISYIAYIFFFGYVLPLGIMSFCYISVVCIIKKCCRCSSTAKAEHKVTLMASAMIVCTVIAWTPYAVVSLMASLGYRHLLGPVAAVCPAVFAKTSVIYNPIVYFFFNTQIRDVIISKLPGKRLRGPTSTEISMETKRGLTIVNTMVSSPHIGGSVENVTTKNL
ncbi:rhodopsin-like [Uloborus diversus]|uniref:rhodopsin-like n=1 Tax=Uloborus diversus TaxID=327109 RepID=UPI00240A4DA2|nr:rhodopsin-like [Uloborus diversus]